MKNQPKSHPLAALSADELLEHAAWLRSFAGALVRDPNEADDLVQGAFGAAVTAPSAVRDLRGYLAGTVRWLAWKDRRAHTRRRDRDTIHAREMSRTAPPADEPLEVMDMMRVVLEEVGKLPKTQGRAISLHFVEQLSPNEIAQREGTSASTVRSNLARGLRTLRERLDERNGDRASWCMVLAPFSLPAPGGAAAIGIESPALGATAPATVVTSASVLVSLMSLKLATLVAVPLALAATWYLTHDSDVDPIAPASGLDATVARTESTDFDRQSNADAEELDVVTESGSRAVAVDATTSRGPDGTLVLHPIVGRVLDRETGEGVPGLRVNIDILDGDGKESIERIEARTDTDGTFTVADRVIEAGMLRVEVIDGDMYSGKTVFPPIRLEFPFQVYLPVRIGPTFRFDYQGMGEQNLRIFEVQASGPGVHAKRPRSTQTRLGVHPWVRFGEPLADEGEVGPWELRLLSPDGLRVGTGVVHRRVGVEPSLVPIAFEAKGAIQFVLPRGGGASPLSIVQVSGDDGFEQLVELESIEGPLEGLVKHLEPGTYHWSMAAGDAVALADVEVIAGEVTIVELEPAAAAGGRIGIVDATAAPGVDLSRWDCVVFNESNVDENFRPRPILAPSLGSDMWTVPLGTIPRTGWKLTLQPKAGFEADPSIVSVDSAGTSQTIRVLQSKAQISVTLEVVDSVTGERLPFSTAVHVDGVNMQSVKTDGDGGFEKIAVSAERASLFLVRKNGYELTEAQFEPGRDRATLRVALKRGWRNRVAVVDASTFAFMPGVSVHIDGELAGTTGADGVLWFDGDGPPKLIEVASDNEHLEVSMSPFERTERGPGDPVPGYLFLVRESK